MLIVMWFGKEPLFRALYAILTAYFSMSAVKLKNGKNELFSFHLGLPSLELRLGLCGS